MKKNSYLFIATLAIVMAVYNIIAFVIPVVHSANFWWAYGVTMFAIVFQLAVSIVAFGKAETLKSKFLGIPVLHVGIVYLILQLIAGFVFMIAPIQVWISIVVYALLLGIAGICMIAADVGRDYVVEVENKTATKVFYLKSIQNDLETLINKTENALIKQEIKKLADSVKYSDPMSHNSLYAIEEKIKEQVAELCESVEIKDDGMAKSLIAEIGQMIVERNKKCKILK